MVLEGLSPPAALPYHQAMEAPISQANRREVGLQASCTHPTPAVATARQQPQANVKEQI